MNRPILAIAVAVIAFVAGALIYFNSAPAQKGQINALKIIAAAKAYRADLKAKGLIVPPAVSLQALIDRRLLNPSDVGGFGGMDVSVSLLADHSRPGDVLVQARLASGETIVLLADGSIRELPRGPAGQPGQTNAFPLAH